MDIRALVTVTKIKGVLWFVIRNPFLILRRGIRWSLTLLFWLFVLGWGISVFAVESTPATSKEVQDTSSPSDCYGNGYGSAPGGSIYTLDTCSAWYAGKDSSIRPSGDWFFFVGSYRLKFVRKSDGADTGAYVQVPARKVTRFFCPPDGKPTFIVGPKLVNGNQVCETAPLTCKMGEVKTVTPAGAETCNENCASVAGQGMTDAAYNQAFLPSATVTCYGSCSVISQGTTVELPNDGFTQHGDIQFTGDKCPVTFPEEGDGQPVYNDQPTSSDETNAAQNQLQNAASGATSNPVSGATGTADLNAVVDKLAETSNAQIKAMSEQNAALGKVIEGVGKDLQGAIKQSGGGGGSGASMGQMQTANAIKEGNATLKEIADKLDEQQDPEPPVKPSSELEPDPTAIHEANDWGQRNFGTVLKANADRFRALPIFAAPTNFFRADFAGTSCPSYSGSFSLFGATTDVQMDAFCSPSVINTMPYIRAVVIMFCLWLSWRIAVGNGG